ncbi:hypothetical protein RyT2_11850 [Pseudolactococcus yaeyamensis]
MKFRKTATNKRSGYIYKFADGKRVLIQLNQEGVTEIDIQRLHALDDSEVYYNIKNSRPNPESDWNISIESFATAGNVEDKNPMVKELYQLSQIEENPQLAIVREILKNLKPELQELYLLLSEGQTNSDVARTLKVDKSTVGRRKEKLIKEIQKRLP